MVFNRNFSKILVFFDKIDIFPTKISLVRDKSSKVSTMIGKILSILIFAYSINRFSSCNMIMKKNPSTYEQTLNAIARPKISLTKDNFEIAFGINDDLGVYSNDSTYFSMSAYLFYQNNVNLTSEYIFLDLVPCDNEHFNDNTTFERLKLSGAYCLKNGTSLEIFGFWDENSVKYFEIDFLRCVNNTDVICKSKEEIDNFLENHYVQFYIRNNYIDISNFENPLMSNFKSFYHPLAVDYAKVNTLYLEQVSLKTEYGILVRETQELYSYKWGINELEIYNRKPYIYTMNLYSSDTIQVVDRKYQTIESFLGELGGLFNFLFFFGFALAKIEETYTLTMFLGNKLMIFQSLKLKKQKHNTRKYSESIKRKINLKAESIPNLEMSKSEKNKKSEIFGQTSLNKFENKFLKENKLIGFKLSKKVLKDEEIIYEGSEKNVQPLKNFKILKNFPENIIESKTERPHNTSIKNLNVLTENSKVIGRIKSLKEEYTSKKCFEFSGLKYFLVLLKFKRFCLTEEEKLYLEGEKYISQEMDIFFILKKLRELEKLKQILLSKNQLFFFNILPDHLENLEMKFERKFLRSKPKNNLEKMYLKLVQNSTISKLDKKILRSLQEDVFD